jgi:hypothetical protein
MHVATRHSESRLGSHTGVQAFGAYDQRQKTTGIDSLFILPLRIIPFKTEIFAGARLVKNSSLVGVVEIYRDTETGSGQIAVHDLPAHFHWKEGASHPDLAILERLAMLPSYDVYSLRRSLRELGIAVNNHEDLKLSEEKSRELAGYMRCFTSPLLRHIYGDSGAEVTRFEDLVMLFADPDVNKARMRLKVMADKLKINTDRIPRFLEDYADIFLSLSYYNHCLDHLSPLLDSFIYAMKDLRKVFQVRTNAALCAEMERIERLLIGLTSFLRRSFEDFGAMSQDMWRNLSASKFEQVKAHIEDSQARIGGVLCGLTVKMNVWILRFPNPLSGSPGAKGEFIMSDMRPGLAGLAEIARGRDAFGLTTIAAPGAGCVFTDLEQIDCSNEGDA